MIEPTDLKVGGRDDFWHMFMSGYTIYKQYFDPLFYPLQLHKGSETSNAIVRVFVPLPERSGSFQQKIVAFSYNKYLHIHN